MDATPRFRLFDSRRGDRIDQEEGAAQTLPRRRMVTSMSVARARRRNRRRPGTQRGLALVPRLLSLSGASSSRRRTVFMLLLAVCAVGALASARLMAWVVSSRPLSSSPSSTVFSPLKPPRHAPFGGGAASSGGDNADVPRAEKRRRPAVSLGPDAIPSVVLVDRRPAGGARRASGLDAGGEGERGAVTEADRPDGNPSQHPQGCLNTAQGAVLIADSEGRVCRRSEVDDVHRPGCCAGRPPPLPGGAGAGDDNALGAPAEGYADRGVAASRAAGGASKVRKGRALELVALHAPPVTTHGGAAAAAAAVVQSQPGGDGTGEGAFPPEQALSTPYSCWSCDEGGDGGGGDRGGDGGGYSSCCRSYEFCVSCCQAPRREEEREVIREAAARSGHPVYRELGLSNGGSGDAAADWERKQSPHQLLRGGAEGEGSPPAEEREHEARKAREEAAFAHCAFRCRTYSGSVAHENSYRGPLKHCFGRFRPPGAAPGVLAAGARGQAVVPAEGEGEVVRSGGAGAEREGPPLQLDPFLASLAEGTHEY